MFIDNKWKNNNELIYEIMDPQCPNVYSNKIYYESPSDYVSANFRGYLPIWEILFKFFYVVIYTVQFTLALV